MSWLWTIYGVPAATEDVDMAGKESEEESAIESEDGENGGMGREGEEAKSMSPLRWNSQRLEIRIRYCS